MQFIQSQLLHSSLNITYEYKKLGHSLFLIDSLWLTTNQQMPWLFFGTNALVVTHPVDSRVPLLRILAVNFGAPRSRQDSPPIFFGFWWRELKQLEVKSRGRFLDIYVYIYILCVDKYISIWYVDKYMYIGIYIYICELSLYPRETMLDHDMISLTTRFDSLTFFDQIWFHTHDIWIGFGITFWIVLAAAVWGDGKLCLR